MTSAQVTGPAARPERATHRVGALTLRELGQAWWRPAAVVLLMALAIGWRLVRTDLGAPPNLEFMTASTFAAALLLRHRVAALVPLLVAVASDLVLGNTAVLWFVWGAWAMIGLAAVVLPRWRGRRRYIAALGFGLGGSVFFYLLTNAGVWLLGRGAWYSDSLDGLAASYVAGLPFLRTMLIGNLLLVPALAVVVSLAERWEEHARGSAPVSRIQPEGASAA